MSDKFFGVEDISDLTKPATLFVPTLPASILMSENKKDFRERMQSGLSQVADQTKGILIDKAIDKSLTFLDKTSPTLAGVARAALGKPKVMDDSSPPEGPYIDGWYKKAVSRIDPLLSIHWDIDLPTINGIDLGSEYIEDIQPTMTTYDDLNFYLNGKRDYFCGVQDISGLTLTCYEDAVLTSFTYWNEWKRSIRNNEDGTYAPPDSYMKTVYLYVTAFIGKSLVPILKFKVLNVFPRELQGFDFTSAGSERLRPTVTLSCSDIQFDPDSGAIAEVKKEANE